MKTVLLYGDSIFWGMDGNEAKRHDLDARVGTCIQQSLGNEVEIITEGLRGRTMFGENGSFPQRDGLAQFGPIFASHLPLDVLVIMLGSNDANATTQHSATDVANALDEYMKEAKSWCDFMGYAEPQLLVVAPPDVATDELVKFAELFKGAAERVTDISDSLMQKATDRGWAALDSRRICKSMGQDGIHLSANETHRLASAIADHLGEMLS